MAFRNKRGLISLMLIFFIFFALFVMIIAGTAFYGIETFDNAARNITGMNVGNVSFSDTYEDTLGRGLRTVLSTLSTISMALILGMIIVMLIIGFKMPKQNKLWIILDLFIIVVAFIAAVYISVIFNDFINSSETFLNIYSVDLQKPSTFLLNLPFVIAIVGGLIILATYVSSRGGKEPNVLEFN
ncbi:MAG TPA: hypothetical protein ENI23_12715 [bacterium]|nr:hypothetical protein [bacterium]